MPIGVRWSKEDISLCNLYKVKSNNQTTYIIYKLLM